MAKSKINEESTEEVFNFIDRAYAQEQEETFIKKLRDSICIDLDSRMRKITRDSGKTTPDISLYERLVSHLAGQILYLEDEVRKKDILIEKLIDSSLDSSNKSQSQSKCTFCSASTLKNSKSLFFSDIPSNNLDNICSTIDGDNLMSSIQKKTFLIRFEIAMSAMRNLTL